MGQRRRDFQTSRDAGADLASHQAQVFTELFALNFRDELPPEPASPDVHAAFVRALHATVCDMPARLEGERQRLSEPEAVRPRPRRRRWAVHLVIALKAAALAALFRATLYLGTGH